MNYVRFQVWKLLRTQHMGNFGKGIMWDYGECGDFIDCVWGNMKESQNPRSVTQLWNFYVSQFLHL